MTLKTDKVPATVEIKVHSSRALLSYSQVYVRKDIYDKAVEQRNELVRNPKLTEDLNPDEIIAELNEELGFGTGQANG